MEQWKPYRIKDLYLKNKENEPKVPFLLPTREDIDNFPFLEYYKDHFESLDDSFNLLKQSYIPLANDGTDISNVLDTFKFSVMHLLILNSEKYNRLWDAYTVQYNPIENYNRVEETTLTKNGSEKNEINIGTRTDNITSGERKSTTTNNNTTYNNDTLHLNDNSIIDTESVTDTNTIGEQSNTDTLTFDNRTDTTKSKISGNIGITTSQMMIGSSLTLYESFNFFKIMFNDITKELCYFFV